MAEAAMIDVFMGESPWVGLILASQGQTRVTSGAAVQSHGRNLGPGTRRRKCPLFIISIAPVHQRSRPLLEGSETPAFSATPSSRDREPRPIASCPAGHDRLL